jgi:hypothetical protein
MITVHDPHGPDLQVSFTGLRSDPANWIAYVRDPTGRSILGHQTVTITSDERVGHNTASPAEVDEFFQRIWGLTPTDWCWRHVPLHLAAPLLGEVPMGEEEYRAILHQIAWTQSDAGRYLAGSDVTGRRWAVDGPPKAVAIILRYMAKTADIGESARNLAARTAEIQAQMPHPSYGKSDGKRNWPGPHMKKKRN